MSWTSILTALALAASTAYLVIEKHWEMWVAVAVITLVMTVLLVSVFSVLMLNTPKDKRYQEWIAFKEGFNEAIQAMINTVRGKGK